MFTDMPHYTVVKNTTCKGIPLPAIAIDQTVDSRVSVVGTFGYEDYRPRLS